MYDKYLIVGEEFKNIVEDGKVTGFQIGERLPYYRGVVLSLVGDTDLSVDGEHYSPDKISVTLGEKTYKLRDLENEADDRWEFGDVGILKVEKPGGLEPGEHGPGPLDLILGGGEYLVQDVKLTRVDRGFAVEAQ